MAGIDATAFAQRFTTLARALPDPETDQLLDAVVTEDVADGEMLVAEGATSDALFLLWDGELEVLIDEGGTTSHVATLRSGSIVGEVSLFDPGAATASIRSKGSSTVLRLDHAAVDRLFAAAPAAATDFLSAVTHTLAERVEASLQRLERAADDHDALIDVEHALYTTEES